MKVFREVKLVFTGKTKNPGVPILETTRAFAEVRKEIELETIEIFIALFLDGRNCVIDQHEISRGTINSSLTHPRETFRAAIKDGATAIILGHNHPSGNPSPSAEDIAVTRNLVKAGNIIGIPILDHIIIGANCFLSLKEQREDLFFKEGQS